jgi:3D (Asp-Asp-Asp) domain-containing protein
MLFSEAFENKIKAGLLVFDCLIGLLVVVWYCQDRIQDRRIDTYIEVSITSYRPIKTQTDSSPNWTSIGEPAVMGNVAASQDLLADGTLHYGDVVLITGLGVFRVNDTMNARHKRHLDILVYTKTQERCVGWRKDVKVRILKP